MSLKQVGSDIVNAPLPTVVIWTIGLIVLFRLVVAAVIFVVAIGFVFFLAIRPDPNAEAHQRAWRQYCISYHQYCELVK